MVTLFVRGLAAEIYDSGRVDVSSVPLKGGGTRPDAGFPNGGEDGSTEDLSSFALTDPERKRESISCISSGFLFVLVTLDFAP